MATQTTIKLVCDLTGDPADETVEFGIRGKTFEIDLTKQHADALTEILEDYIKVARPISRTVPRRPRQGTTLTGTARPTQAIREWAREHGLAVSDRGRIRGDVRAAFEAAHAA